MKARFTVVGLAAAAALCAQQPAVQLVTQKFDYKPVKQIQAISLVLEKIEIRQIVFAPASEAGGKQRHSVPEAVVSIANGGAAPATVGVAIAIFDGDGNLVAAGSGGTRPGWFAPGERENCPIRFPYVYRNLDKAKTFVLTMEVRKKEPSPDGASPAGSKAD
jgi:hypothetical protein